jgi:hypothetical protein
MNPRIAELIRLNGYKFNVLFGIIALFIVPMIPPYIDLQNSGFVVGLFALFMYFGEAWAFWYKTRLMRVRIVYQLTEGEAGRTVPPLPKLGYFVGFGFLLRFCFRFIFLLIALHTFGLMPDHSDQDIGGFAMTILILAALFEIFMLAVTWFESRLEKDDEEEQPQKAERIWREKNFPMLKDPNLLAKEGGADLVLFIAAMMFTHVFWTMSNNNFIESIDSSYAAGDWGVGVLLGMVIANFVLCLFMLVPIRLAYWVGESISTFTPQQRRSLRFSFLFAGLSVTAPVFIHFVKTYCRI